MTDSDLAVLIVGIVLVVLGVVVILFRKAVLDLVLRGQTDTFGETVGARMRTVRPSHIAAVGVFACILGVVLIVLAFVPGS